MSCPRLSKGRFKKKRLLKTAYQIPGALRFLPVDLAKIILEFVGRVKKTVGDNLELVPEWTNGFYGQYPISVKFPLFA